MNKRASPMKDLSTTSEENLPKEVPNETINTAVEGQKHFTEKRETYKMNEGASQRKIRCGDQK